MILILSTDGDVSTSHVCDWLYYYNIKFIRLNDNDITSTSLEVIINEGVPYFSFFTSGKYISSKEISTVWFRKFGFYNFTEEYFYLKKTNNIELIQQFTSEYFSMTRIILFCLKDKKWLTDIRNAITDKFAVLTEAKNVGLNIPNSKIINSIEGLTAYKSQYERIITKSLKEGSQISFDKHFLAMFTTEILDADILSKSLPNVFMPSLIQELIEKEYELRIFFLDGKCYSMAIFSQNDKQTEVDFRKYNFAKPNRNIPYKLPLDVEQKLIQLMNKLRLNCGSIDMVYSRSKKYYFLEVNPCGQFGMTSTPCNYQIEEKIARSLIKLSEA